MRSLWLVGFLGFTVIAPLWAADSTAEYESAAARYSRHADFFAAQSKPPANVEPSFRRDPIQPLIDSWGNVLYAPATPDNNGLMIQGIVDSGDAATALIDDQVYKKGDTVQGCLILEIRGEGITVQKEGKTLFIQLYPEDRAKK